MSEKWEMKDWGGAEYLDGARMQFCVEREPHRVVAYVGDRDRANLIAAAPELLAALESLVALEESDLRGYDDIDVCQELQEARAAISKAKGDV